MEIRLCPAPRTTRAPGSLWPLARLERAAGWAPQDNRERKKRDLSAKHLKTRAILYWNAGWASDHKGTEGMKENNIQCTQWKWNKKNIRRLRRRVNTRVRREITSIEQFSQEHEGCTVSECLKRPCLTTSHREDFLKCVCLNALRQEDCRVCGQPGLHLTFPTPKSLIRNSLTTCPTHTSAEGRSAFLSSASKLLQTCRMLMLIS